MKTAVRFFAFFISVLLCLGGLASCLRIVPNIPVTGTVADPSITHQAEGEGFPAYTMTDATLEEFRAQLAELRELVFSENSDDAVIGERVAEMENAYFHIATQSQIAYILYCEDTNNEMLSRQYLTAEEQSADAYEAYIALCKELDQSSAPKRDVFFAGWTEEDFAEMRGHSEEETRLEQENSRLLVEYHALSDSEFDEETERIYFALIENNNRIAKLNGYDDYWTYAYENVYGRDYGVEEIQRVRELVKKYLVDLCQQAMVMFYTIYERLHSMEREMVLDILEQDYSQDDSYVDGYISTFGSEEQVLMNTIFDEKNSIFAVGLNALEGAFTTYLYSYEQPVCFFGPGYQNSYTVVHELGHYYSFLCNDTDQYQLDLMELQSQGNEWLFTAYLEDAVGGNVAKAVAAYQIYNALAVILIGMVIDEFEQGCYQGKVTYADQLDNWMKTVVAGYGGEDFFGTYITDIYAYWRAVTVQSSVYYVSYAVSMLEAMQVYSVARERGYANAMSCYLAVTDLSEWETLPTFMEVLQAAGLHTPMDEAAYLSLKNLLK
ncbi:MAG: hypothetical protein E7620_04905 [Ruminococcaceae bacterium]|nr:hypothetical protein [Oscillospiraceae bacterium]